MQKPSNFIYVVCQFGIENVLKQELASNHPELKLAFSRPGFLTFKLDDNARWPEKFSLKSTFARTYGWSLGKTEGSIAERQVRNVMSCFEQLVASDQRSSEKKKPLQLHVWERDRFLPGQKGFEPGTSILAHEVGQLFNAKGDLPENSQTQDNHVQSPPKYRVNRITATHDLVLDVVLVEPDQWWYGYHYAVTAAGRWPGGVPSIQPKSEPISRAYFKTAEALAWSGIEIQSAQWCAEIGSAPGGSCQFLLEKGAKVIGIDPAEMDEAIIQHPNFVHIRKRGNEVKKKELAEIKWLFADINIVPNYTLDTISDIVSHTKIHIKGLILTMKMTDWQLADRIPEFRRRIRDLGFKLVKTRQLAFNRQEFCLVAVRDKFALRASRKRGKRKG